MAEVHRAGGAPGATESGGVQPGEAVTSRSGIDVLARKNVTLFRRRTSRVAQPREFVRGRPTRVVRRAERPARMLTLTPRTACPPSVRQAVTRANRRLPRLSFLVFTVSWTGRRLYDVLCVQGSRAARVRHEERVPRILPPRVRVGEDADRRERRHDQRRARGRALRRRDIWRGEADPDLGGRNRCLRTRCPVDVHRDPERIARERGLDQPHGLVPDSPSARELLRVRVCARILRGDRPLDLDASSTKSPDLDHRVQVADLRPGRLRERDPVSERRVDGDDARGVVVLILADPDDDRAAAPEAVAGPGGDQRRVVRRERVTPEGKRERADRREQEETNCFGQETPFQWGETPFLSFRLLSLPGG